MGFSHLLQAKQRFRFHTIGFTKQRRVYFSTPSSKKAGCSGEQKVTAVESYVNKYVKMLPGTFRKATQVQNEVGGSRYTLKGILLKLKEKIIGNSEVQSHSSNGDKSNYTADATTSTVIASHNNSSEKPGLGKPESTLANDLCSRSDVSSSAVPCISRRTSSENITAALASETNRTYSSLENTEISKPRSLIQSSEASTDSDSQDNNVSHATCSSTEEHSSANMFNATASAVTRVHDSTDQAKLPEAAYRAPLSDIVPNSSSNENNCLTGALSHLCGDIVKAECVSDGLNIVQSRNDHMEPKELWNKKSKAEHFSCLIHEVSRTLQDKTEYKRASTGCRNHVESKTIASSFKTNVVSELGKRPSLFDGDQKRARLVDLFDKKLDEQPEIERDNGHLQSEETLSGLLVSSEADQTTRILQEVIQNISASPGNGHNQPDNQWKVSRISLNVVSEGGGLPASGDDAQKITQTMKEQEVGHMLTKCNIWPPNGILEDSSKTIGGNVKKYPNMKLLTDCNKKLRGQQVVSTHESIASSRTDQNHTSDRIRVVQSQANMQKFGNKEKQTSSKLQSAKESPMRIGDLNKTQVVLSTEALHENKVIVRFLNKTDAKRDIVAAFRSFGDILKTQVSDVRRNFKIATLYFKTRDGMEKALQTIDLVVNGKLVIVEPASSLENLSKKISIPNLIGDPDVPAALVKNPTRTVAIKQLTPEICSRHIEDALTFCESKISGIFLGSSSSVAYVEFETEDGKERALAKFSIVVLGKRLLIFRIDTPRTTVVRISIPNSCGAAKKLDQILKSCGKVRHSQFRCNNIMDVHFSITEWPNMLKILNKLNGMQVMGHQLLAEPASVIPPDVLRELYSRPEERRRLKADMLRLLCKLGENAVHKTRLTEIADKLYGE